MDDQLLLRLRNFHRLFAKFVHRVHTHVPENELQRNVLPHVFGNGTDAELVRRTLEFSDEANHLELALTAAGAAVDTIGPVLRSASRLPSTLNLGGSIDPMRSAVSSEDARILGAVVDVLSMVPNTPAADRLDRLQTIVADLVREFEEDPLEDSKLNDFVLEQLRDLQRGLERADGPAIRWTLGQFVALEVTWPQAAPRIRQLVGAALLALSITADGLGVYEPLADRYRPEVVQISDAVETCELEPGSIPPELPASTEGSPQPPSPQPGSEAPTMDSGSDDSEDDHPPPE